MRLITCYHESSPCYGINPFGDSFFMALLPSLCVIGIGSVWKLPKETTQSVARWPCIIDDSADVCYSFSTSGIHCRNILLYYNPMETAFEFVNISLWNHFTTTGAWIKTADPFWRGYKYSSYFKELGYFVAYFHTWYRIILDNFISYLLDREGIFVVEKSCESLWECFKFSMNVSLAFLCPETL